MVLKVDLALLKIKKDLPKAIFMLILASKKVSSKY